MSATAPGRLDIELKADKEIPKAEVEAARDRIAKLERYLKEPPAGTLRITLRKLHSGRDLSKRPYLADADMRFQGRTIAAHTTGGTAVEAADELVERMRRQIRRIVDTEVAQRNEPEDRRHRPQKRLKPPEQRRIVESRSYPSVPKATTQAVTELLDLDLEFLPFRHAQTGEDVVVYRRRDGSIGLIHPPGSSLAGENENGLVVPEPSRYPAPLKLDDARAEIDELNDRFLYFVDLDDGRGKVLYLRHDGDYGLVEPAA